MGFRTFVKKMFTPATSPVPVVPVVAYPVHFAPTKDFFSKEFGSMYCHDYIYTVRPGNEKLANTVQQWVRENKVYLVKSKGLQAQVAHAEGIGEVK